MSVRKWYHKLTRFPFVPLSPLRLCFFFSVRSRRFPQEFIVKLGSTAQVTRIKTLTTNVKSMVVERCEGVAPISWEKVFDMECPDTDGRLQVESSQVNKITANFLKFKFVSGWDEYMTVHRVQVEGKTNNR